MKKIILIICALISVMVVGSSLYAQAETVEYLDMNMRLPVVDADNINYQATCINKLDRGLVNGATFWAEIPAEVAKVSKESNPLMGATAGLVQGTFTSVVRAGTALLDIATFFIPPYDKPLMKPEYAYNRADEKIRDYLW